jgi:hypothetical protein
MTLETIKLKNFNNHFEWFRKLESYECPTLGDICVDVDFNPLMCSSIWHGSPTVADMKRINSKLEYYREYPNHPEK